MLGDGMRRVGRDTAHANPKLCGGFQIDIVESRTAQRDMPYAIPRKDLQTRAVDSVIDEDAHCCKAFGESGSGRRQPAFKKFDLVTTFCEVLPVVRLGIEEGNFHASSLVNPSRPERAKA